MKPKNERDREYVERKLDEFKMFNAYQLWRWQQIHRLFVDGNYREAIKWIRGGSKHDRRRKKSNNP